MQDLRSAWRALRQSPVVSAAAILSLALGIGANTALFSVVDALLLRTLPVRQPDRLVTVSSGFALGHGFTAGAGMNYDIWTRMRERALGTTSFEDGFAWVPMPVDLSDGGEMQPADALFTSGGFFTTLGVPALLGRTFSSVDDQKGGGPDGLVAVISYRLWQRRFAGAGDVIGKTLPVDGVACTVIGVMPPAFFGIEVGQPFDVALPLAAEPAIRGARASLHLPSALMLTAMFTLAPGQTPDGATAALRAMQADILGLSGASPPSLPAMPGEASAAASVITPFSPATKSLLFAYPKRLHEQVVSPEFFTTYGQVIRAGRDFDGRDSAQAPRVAIVSESYVNRFLTGPDPLTVTLESGACDRRNGTCKIVGVVTDIAFGPSGHRDSSPAFYSVCSPAIHSPSRRLV